MAEARFERPPRDAGTKELADYLHYLASELEYVLSNLDEDNMTEAYLAKEEKTNG